VRLYKKKRREEGRGKKKKKKEGEGGEGRYVSTPQAPPFTPCRPAAFARRGKGRGGVERGD